MTALQALALLNDGFMLEQAHQLALRVHLQGHGDGIALAAEVAVPVNTVAGVDGNAVTAGRANCSRSTNATTG